MELTGCGTALVTPFRRDGGVDEPALHALVNWQIESGIDFLVPCGTTGEASTLTESEWLRVTLASIGDAVISTDAEGRVTYMNGVAETLTGWPLAEALGRPLPDVFRIVNEDTRRPVADPALRALREGTTENATVCKALLADLRERGLDLDQAILFVIDGGTGLRKAIRETGGTTAIVHSALAGYLAARAGMMRP